MKVPKLFPKPPDLEISGGMDKKKAKLMNKIIKSVWKDKEAEIMKMAKCEFFGHDVVWDGGGYSCANCSLEFKPTEDYLQNLDKGDSN